MKMTIFFKFFMKNDDEDEEINYILHSTGECFRRFPHGKVAYPKVQIYSVYYHSLSVHSL